MESIVNLRVSLSVGEMVWRNPSSPPTISNSPFRLLKLRLGGNAPENPSIVLAERYPEHDIRRIPAVLMLGYLEW